MLQRLVSGYHTSVATQIYANYFPPARGGKGEGAWLPNAEGFRAKVARPAWIEDMQFAFVVMARSLFKIKSFLYSDYPFVTGNATEDETTRSLVRHLLDTSVLSSCGSVVVSGFDESRLFPPTGSVAAAATDFKQTFRRVSRMVHCVACKRCRLHATVALHGIGAAIKILFSPPDLVAQSLSRADLVALVNTVHSLSDSIARASQLMQHANASSTATAVAASVPDASATPAPAPAATPGGASEAAIRAVAAHRASLTRFEEDALVSAALRGEASVLLLARALLQGGGGTGSPSSQQTAGPMFVRHALIALGIQLPDAVVVGGGLAGLVTAVSLAQRGGAVVVVEKQKALGGNSAKASSGINSLRGGGWTGPDEEAAVFLADTLKSQGAHGDPGLAAKLVRDANASVAWLERVTALNLSSVGQLGGHAVARTWKPERGVVGAEIMAALSAVVKRTPGIRVVTQATVTRLVTADSGAVQGVEYADSQGQTRTLHSRAVVLAAGGFGFDAAGLLKEYRPDLVNFPTTLGAQTTGDGIRLAAATGAGLVDMDYVQLHPTGFVDPREPDARVKVLAAEVLRGVGGVLLKRDGGARFVNELGTRKAVTDRMLAEGDGPFWLVLSARSAALAPSHAHMYVSKGLLRNVTASGLAEAIPGAAAALGIYSAAAAARAPDAFGRADRLGLPYDEGPYWLVGQVTPVVHYTMGGVRIDEAGRVLSAANGSAPIPGLFAVGEVTGGVHGENRLGGNSLLECVVYGLAIGGSSLAISPDLSPSAFNASAAANSVQGYPAAPTVIDAPPIKRVSASTLAAHSQPNDCWTAISGSVYDLSGFAEEHAGGADSITQCCGRDLTERFLTAHTTAMLGAGAGFPSLGDFVL